MVAHDEISNFRTCSGAHVAACDPRTACRSYDGDKRFVAAARHRHLMCCFDVGWQPGSGPQILQQELSSSDDTLSAMSSVRDSSIQPWSSQPK